MVKAFSKYSNGDEQLTANFKVKEFACKDGSNTILIDVDFVKNKLQRIREKIGVPIVITSGYRTIEHNKMKGGADSSYHLSGRAFDIVASGVSPHRMSQIAEELGVKGIIEYNTFTHIDSREVKYFARDDNGKITKKKCIFF